MPKDPIPEVGTEVGRQLYADFARAANGKSVEDVLAASINTIANAIRQTYGLRREAEARMKELYGRNLEILLEHYDPVTGRRRSVTPFHQVVTPSLIISDDNLLGPGGG